MRVSQANANQQTSCAGRTGSGYCYRLNTEMTHCNGLFENTDTILLTIGSTQITKHEESF